MRTFIITIAIGLVDLDKVVEVKLLTISKNKNTAIEEALARVENEVASMNTRVSFIKCEKLYRGTKIWKIKEAATM